jgi:multidrug efflux pump subunit AcrA (membrane-fusion protein)
VKEEASVRRPFALGIVLCALLVAVSACSHKSAGRNGRSRVQASPAPVPTAVAKQATVKPTLTIAGIIAPFQNVAISSSLSEPTLAVYVNEGDHVRRGQVLAKLDVTDLDANLEAAEATAKSDDERVAQSRYSATLAFGQSPDTVTQQRAALRSAQETARQARIDLARYKALVAEGYIANQQYVQQETTVATDDANVRSAQAALDSAITSQAVNGTPAHGLQQSTIASSLADAASAHAAADEIKAQIARATIVSPVDGVVVNRNLNAGEYPGSRTNFTVQEISQVYAELNASSADVFRIHSGSPVNITAGADSSGRVYHGSIVAVLGQVSPGSTNFTVKALVQNPDSSLQSGIPVTGTISLGPTTGIGIPSTAFLDDTNTSVYAVRDGAAQMAKVQQVATDGKTSIVSGLDDGTPVVSNGQLGITPGQAINPTPGPSGGAEPPGEAPSPGASGAAHHHKHAQASPAP